MSFLLSNRLRPLKIAALLFLIWFLCYLNIEPGSHASHDFFTRFPNGQTRTFAHLEIISISEEEMVVSIPDGRFAMTVSPVQPDAQVGDIVTLSLTKRNGRLVVEKYHLRTLRNLKIWLSIPVLFLTLILFIRDFSFDKRRFVFVSKRNI